MAAMGKDWQFLDSAISRHSVFDFIAAIQPGDLLPGRLATLTPTGQAPAGGLGNARELMGVLGSVFSG
jgi:hypothetical protein